MTITPFPAKKGSLANPSPAEYTSTQDAHTAVQSLNSNINTIGSALGNEATTRANADTALQNSITAEVTARTNAVASEATTRANADTALQNSITAEVTARANAVASEATTRANADTALQNSITAEVTARANAVALLDTTQRYINPSTGSDANDGLAPATAWQSFANLPKVKSGTITITGANNLSTANFLNQNVTVINSGWTGSFSGSINISRSSVRFSGDTFRASSVVVERDAYVLLDSAFILSPATVSVNGFDIADGSTVLATQNILFQASANVYVECYRNSGLVSTAKFRCLRRSALQSPLRFPSL
jgi:hypothetical protein